MAVATYTKLINKSILSSSFLDCWKAAIVTPVLKSGAVLEGFLRFPETIQDFPWTMGAPLFSYNVSQGIHSGLNSSVNWPLF